MEIDFNDSPCVHCGRKPRKRKTRRLLEAITAQLATVLAQQENIMSGISDLNDAVAGIASDLQAEDAEIAQVIAALQAGNLTDAQAEALATQLQASRTNIQQATQQLTAALTPPPPGQ